MPIKEAQQTHTQHAVPQNIMDVEFKLIGDLTMRQFTYLLVFGLAGYIFSITLVGFFKLPLSLGAVLIGLALAFVPIQERGMDEWIVNFVKAVYGPTHFLWKKESVLPAAFTYQSLNVVRQEMITLAPTSSRRKLEEYLELQKGTVVKDELDIPEEEYLLKVKAAFADVKVAASPIADQQEVPAQESPGFKPFSQQQPETTEPPHMENVTEAPEQPVVPEETHVQDIKPAEEVKIEKDVVSTPSPVVQPKPTPKKSPQPVKRTFPHARFNKSSNQDRHVGRRFTNLLPAEGKLILPVRGEMVLQTSEQIDIEKDLNSRTDQLRNLLDQIRGDETFKGIIAAGPDIPQDASSKQKIYEAQDVVDKVRFENEKLSEEIQQLKSNLGASKETEEEKQKKQQLIAQLEKEKNKNNADYSSLQKQVHELQQRLKEKENSEGVNMEPKKAAPSKMKPLTKDPNILSGALKDVENKALEGTVLLIKNDKGEAVRAVKTNSLGQFSISTALTNGMYTIEVGTGIDGQTFDIITVEVKGDVVPPIEITGRPV